MSYTCPMTFENIDSNSSRINSLLVSVLVVIYLISSNVFVLYFLFIDFGIKLFLDKKFSPLSLGSKFIKSSLKINTVLIDGGAKRLAAYFGLIFVGLLIMTHYLDNQFLTLIVAFIFVSCSLLDLIFNYCLGCKIYYIIKKIYPNFMS